MKKFGTVLAVVFLAASVVCAQDARELIVEGVNLGKQQKFEEALANFNRALEIDPASLAAYINIATASFLASGGEDKSGYIEAVKALERASTLAPHDRQASRWMMQNGGLIVLYLEEKIKSGEDDPKVHYDLASAYMLLGDAERAIDTYEKAASLAPDSAPISSDLGRALVRAGRTEEGKRALMKAIELDPALSGALVNLANLLYREGDLEEALTLYEKAVESDPDSATAHAQLGNLYLEMGKLEEAKRALNAALKLNRHLINTYLDLADTYLREKNYRAAIQQCEAALREKQKFPEAEILLGELYYLEKDYKNARKHYRKYLQTSRQHVVEDKQVVERFRKHCKGRMETLKKLVGKRRPKKSSEKLFEMAHRYYESGDYEGAINVINQILEKDESMGKAYTLLGIIFLKKDEPDPGLAMSIFRGALRDNVILDKGSRILTLHGLAEACARSDRPDDAEKNLLELIELQPDYVSAYYSLARLYATKDEPEKSIHNLRKGATLEREKGMKTTLDLALEDDSFDTIREKDEIRILKEEFKL